MHAIRQHEFGPAETLRYEEVPDPVPGAEQVRIAVEAAGLHLIDTKIRAGFSGGPLSPPQLPMTPGREVAGTVDLLGPGADEHWRGRRVVAHLGQANGGYAELAHRVRRVAARDPRRPERRGGGRDDRHRPHRGRHPRHAPGSKPTTPCS